MGNVVIRDFHEDLEYRSEIEQFAKDALAKVHWRKKFSEVLPTYEIKDVAERIALAAFDGLARYHGDILKDAETYAEEYVDIVAQIVRQGLNENVYENMTPREPIPLEKADMGSVDPSQPMGLFDNAYTRWAMNRWENVGSAFMAAENWAHRDGVTERERCHGVAQAVYGLTGMQKTLDRNTQDVTINPAQDYTTYYEKQFDMQIRNRSMRAAKELFGGK
jgi:hypothetical protein